MAAFSGAYVGYLDELDRILDSHLKHRCWKIAMTCLVLYLDSLLQSGNSRHLKYAGIYNKQRDCCLLPNKEAGGRSMGIIDLRAQASDEY